MSRIYVIIPVYNAEKYLKQTVDSVLDQACPDIRIVLVDDGSRDGSAALCDQLAREYNSIQVIHQENGGVSRARNTGIEYVLQEESGDAYLAFLDADDLWYPGFLTPERLEEISRANRDILAFGTVTCNENAACFSAPQPYHREVIAGGSSAIWSLRDHVGANLYHISLFRKWDVRFFEGYRYSEDKYFKVLSGFFAESIEFSPAMMYIYRETSGGAMSRSSRMGAAEYFLPIIDGWMRTEEEINRHAEVTGVRTDVGRILGNVYLLDMICRHYMQQGSGKEIRKIVSEHPNYPFLLAMQPMGEQDSNYQRKEQYFNYPGLFAVKYRMKGVIWFLLRLALRIPAVRNWNERRKYPLNYLP